MKSAAIDEEVERIISAPYRRELIPNEDGTWFARIGEFAGCMTEGDSQAEALSNLEDALRQWVRAQLEDGDPIPPASAETQFSGKFVIRLPSSLHRELSEGAAGEGVSLNSYVAGALARFVGAEGAHASAASTVPIFSTMVGEGHGCGDAPCVEEDSELIRYAQAISADQARRAA
ncbi:MAG: toxin-antitoxin system HicB family antitoxin [Vulcanimicrobiaceae bacterium]